MLHEFWKLREREKELVKPPLYGVRYVMDCTKIVAKLGLDAPELTNYLNGA